MSPENELENLREASDYAAAVRFTDEESGEALRKAGTFIAICAALPDIEALARPG